MLNTIGRFFKALGYLFSGRIGSAREALDADPHVMRAKYDVIIHQKTSRISEYKSAVAAMMAQKESKLAKIKVLKDEITRLGKLKAGAKAKTLHRVETLKKQGLSKERMQLDEEYQKCLAAFNDFSSTLDVKEGRSAELGNDVKQCETSIQNHKIQLQHLVREIEKIRQEAADSVADVISATLEKEIADALSGIVVDGSDKDLEGLRDIRNKMKANAKISNELAGNEGKVAEIEFLEYARSTEASKEFEAGLFDDTDIAVSGANARRDGHTIGR